MPVALHYEAPQEMARLAVALKTISTGDQVRKEFIKRLREPVNTAKKDVQTAVRSLPVSAHRTWTTRSSGAFQRAAYDVYRQTRTMSAEQLRMSRAYDGGRDAVRRSRRAARRSGLRESIARSVGTSVSLAGPSAGLAVHIRPTGMPPDQRTLPYHLDQPKGWRHPLFGDRDYWVQQQGKPYFDTTLMKHQPEYEQAALAVLEEFATRIARAATT